MSQNVYIPYQNNNICFLSITNKVKMLNSFTFSHSFIYIGSYVWINTSNRDFILESNYFKRLFSFKLKSEKF